MPSVYSSIKGHYKSSAGSKSCSIYYRSFWRRFS